MQQALGSEDCCAAKYISTAFKKWLDFANKRVWQYCVRNRISASAMLASWRIQQESIIWLPVT